MSGVADMCPVTFSYSHEFWNQSPGPNACAERAFAPESLLQPVTECFFPTGLENLLHYNLQE